MSNALLCTQKLFANELKTDLKIDFLNETAAKKFEEHIAHVKSTFTESLCIQLALDVQIEQSTFN